MPKQSSYKTNPNSDPVILVVDDAASSRTHHAHMLTKRSCIAIEAHDGEHALELLNQQSIDLILCDMVMPKLDGIGLCRKVRQAPEYQHLPIILYSGSAKPEDRARVFSAGANDLMHHPLHPDELMARIQFQLESAHKTVQVSAYQKRITHEIEQARQMQLMLMPPPAQLEKLNATHQVMAQYFFEPSSEIGGDIWDIFAYDASHVVFYICDFTGHGASAAINTFRLHSLLTQYRHFFKQPGELLSQLNTHLYRMLPAEIFATFFYGVLNIHSNEMCYAVAGSPSPTLYRHGEQRSEMIDTRGLPIGAANGTIYTTQQITFQPNDSLLLYSDVLPKALNDPKSKYTLSDEFIQKHLHTCMQHASGDGQRRFIHDTLKQIGLMDGHFGDDDLTLVLITRSP